MSHVRSSHEAPSGPDGRRRAPGDPAVRAPRASHDSGWVRQRLREARERQARPDIAAKLAAVQTAYRQQGPTGDIDQMLSEIERGYLSDGAGVILVDSNVPMYLVGAEHPLKARARQLAEEAISRESRSVPTLRFSRRSSTGIRRSTDRHDRSRLRGGAGDRRRRLSDRARRRRTRRRILGSEPTRSARDAIHIAVMHARDIDRVMSFDRGFDGIPGIERLE